MAAERNSIKQSRVADITPNRADIHVILMPDSRLWGVNIDFIINKHDKWGDKDITYIAKPTYFPLNISTTAYLEYYGF